MSLRKFFTITAVGCPFVLVGAICAKCRFYSDSYQPVSASYQQQNAISAYIEPVKATLSLAQGAGEAASVRRVASLWLEGSETGKLLPLMPCSVDDSIHSPIKGQIVAANEKVIEELVQLSEKESRTGQFLDAASDLVCALRCAEVLKYSDSVALCGASYRERNLLVQLRSIVPSLTPTQGGTLRRQLVEFTKSQQSLGRIFKLSRFNFLTEIARNDGNDPEALTTMTRSGAGESFETSMKQRGKHHMVADGGYMVQLKLGYIAQQHMLSEANSIIDLLASAGKQASA